MQPGPIYFKTPRKCGIFGVMCEGIPRQVNFLIDEAVSTGKGANAIVNYVNFYFKHYGLGEQHARLHADNCAGQNKKKLFSLVPGLQNFVGTTPLNYLLISYSGTY